MTRDDLEAAIWRAAPDLTHRHKAIRITALNYILDAAEQYTSERALVLADAKLMRSVSAAQRRASRETRPPVAHYGTEEPACQGRAFDPVLTTSRGHVTCAVCKRTHAYREAA